MPATPEFEILYDDLQEGMWLKSLHPRFESASLTPITGSENRNAQITRILQYDRPDAIVIHDNKPILVIERTIEVPSGHNVGQRFARLAAAAQADTPVVYFGPYAAFKHGGDTQGPRYMNLRLFYAMDAVERIEKTAVTTINWPVDKRYEIVREQWKDDRLKEYLQVFFGLYDTGGVAQVNSDFCKSSFHDRQLDERAKFIAAEVEKPEQYNVPPNSVIIDDNTRIVSLTTYPEHKQLPLAETVLYNVGMRYIRSDPYTGMGMLYEYLYAGGPTRRTRNMVFHFPEISHSMWKTAAAGKRPRKDIRLFKQVANAILFSDAIVLAKDL